MVSAPVSRGNTYFNCDGGVNANTQITDGTFTVTLPDSACTFSGNLYRQHPPGPRRRPDEPVVEPVLRELRFATTPFPNTAPYKFTIATVPVTINIVNGTGTPVDYTRITANGYDYATGPGMTQATFKPNNFNHRIGDYMNNPGQLFNGQQVIDALPMPTSTSPSPSPTAANSTKPSTPPTDPPTVDLIVAGISPIWIVSETGAQSDADGVDDYTESLAPNDGDGNNDGTKDSLQQNVASFPAATADGTYVTLAASSTNVKIQNVQTIEMVENPDNAPSGWVLPPDWMELPTAVADFQVTGLAPGVARR